MGQTHQENWRRSWRRMSTSPIEILPALILGYFEYQTCWSFRLAERRYVGQMLISSSSLSHGKVCTFPQTFSEMASAKASLKHC